LTPQERVGMLPKIARVHEPSHAVYVPPITGQARLSFTMRSQRNTQSQLVSPSSDMREWEDVSDSNPQVSEEISEGDASLSEREPPTEEVYPPNLIKRN